MGLGARALAAGAPVAVGFLAHDAVSGEPAPSVAAAGARATVGATIFPLFDIVRTVAGEGTRVELILPPGASPHTFEPRPSTVRRLQAASAIFRIGHGLDDWATRVVAAGHGRQVVVDRGIELRPGWSHAGGGNFQEGAGNRPASGDPDRPAAADPHYYLAARNGARIARTAGEVLGELDPEGAESYRRNAERYGEELEALDAELRAAAARLADRRVATFHGAWLYFAEAYGLEVVAIFEPFPGREPSPGWIRDFQRQVRVAGLKRVFGEPQFSPAALRPLARDLGSAIATLDPLGGVAGRMSFVELLRWNMAQMAGAEGSGGG